MGLYSRWVLPQLIHFACSSRQIERQRRKVVPLARGRVLEVGIGSALNLPHYDPDRVERIVGVEPSAELRRMAAERVERSGIEVEVVDLEDGVYPLETASVDSALITYTLCSIAEPLAALAEVRRVLRPGGELVFCEHGVAPDAFVRRAQALANPTWRLFSGGCNLDRDVPALLEGGGFRIERIERGYLPGWRAGSFNYWGVATPE
jgi:SAM-dependent methyltransferase